MAELANILLAVARVPKYSSTSLFPYFVHTENWYLGI